MENKEINKVFKQVFKAFLIEVMKDDKLAESVDKCNTYHDLHDLLQEDAEYIFYQTLNGRCTECENKDDIINGLDDENSELSDDIYFLERKLSSTFLPKTLDEVYKLEAFKDNIDKFSPTEFESLIS